MPGFTINIRDDYDSGPRFLSRLDGHMSGAMREGARDAARLASERLITQTLARTTMRPEVVNRIVESSFVDTPTGGRGRIGFTEPHPYTIRPKTKQALSFMWRGKRVAFRSVRHPGSRPYALVPRTADASDELARAIFERKVEEALV